MNLCIFSYSVVDDFETTFLFYLDIKITAFRDRNARLRKCFDHENGFSYCNNVTRLFFLLNYPYKPEEWRLFIDSSSSGLKVVLLHNGNKQPSVPLAYSKVHKETNEVMELILDKLYYEHHKWLICSDLKVVGLLMGIQGGNCSYPCFKCLWHKGSKALHYTNKIWPKRPETRVIGQQNVISNELVEKEAIIFPPLHIKLGLMTQLISALVKRVKQIQKQRKLEKQLRKQEEDDEDDDDDDDNEDEQQEQEEVALKNLRQMFPYKTHFKTDSGIFNGPEVNRILDDQTFRSSLPMNFQRALIAFKAVSHGILGSNKAPNYRELVANMITCYRDIDANMSLKLHFLHNHLDEFVENLGDYSDQHGERYHQDIKTMEHRYGGQDHCAMMSDYCWFLIRESTNYATMWDRKAYENYFDTTE